MERSLARSWTAAAAVAVSLLSGCAAPEYTYVRNDDGGTYFKVPATWRQVDQKAIDAAIFGDAQTAQTRREAIWIVAFDAHAEPSITHLLPTAPGADDQPFALVKVHKLSDAERDQVSLNTLRNSMSLPVALSAEERQQLEQTATNPYTNFQLLTDQVLPVTDGVRGVRTIFSLRVDGGPPQTFDETAYLSADGTQISTLLIRCSADCYRARAAEFDAIARSFTVKRLPTQ